MYINVKRGSQFLGNVLFDVTGYKVQDRFSVFSIATRYGLDGSRFRTPLGERDLLTTTVEADLGVQPTTSIVDTVALFMDVKRPESDVDHPAPSPRLMSRAVPVLTHLCLCDMLRRNLNFRVHSNIFLRLDIHVGGPKDERIYSIYFHRLDVQMMDICTSGFNSRGHICNFLPSIIAEIMEGVFQNATVVRKYLIFVMLIQKIQRN
jgi:hypothetical protein